MDARTRYHDLNVDVDAALEALKATQLSVHCWQGDDVGGFEAGRGELSGGGIQATGNYPGKARNVGELRDDLDKAYSLIPGAHRLNLHASYGEFGETFVDRDEITPEHFRGWAAWSSENSVPIDFNCTCFSHPNADDGLTLSSKDRTIRDFWVEHTKRAREITAFFGAHQNTPSIHNVWIPDGFKDEPADLFGHREILVEALDTIFAVDYPAEHVRDAVESKLFGIGSEYCVVGSHEFYLGYALTRNKMLCLDMGHFHPTESVAQKISAVFQFQDELLLHVSRPVRWDSDHVVVLNDDLYSLMKELVRGKALAKTHIGLDFFDATLNRVGAWALGSRSTLKALLFALLEPTDALREYEESGNLFARLALLEELKTLPFGAVWDEYCEEQRTAVDRDLISEVMTYERNVLSKRA